MYIKQPLSIAFGVALLAACSVETGADEGNPSEASRSGVDGTNSDVARAEAALTPDPALVPLVTFYSPSRGDFFTTAKPDWTCGLQGCPLPDPSYYMVGLQGYIYKPSAPQPPGTVPLYSWWSPSRADNLITSNPAWAGSPGAIHLADDGYQLVVVEGYISAVPGSGLPLVSYFNWGPLDNASVNPLRVSLPPGYGSYRTEGYLLGPNSSAGKRCNAHGTPNYTDRPPWIAFGNYTNNTWSAPLGFSDGSAIKISANGETIIDFWGTRKNVAGEGPAPAGALAPGEAVFSLIGRVTSGRVWVPGRGSYAAYQWFPIGAGSGCLEYDSAGVGSGNLQVAINDSNLGDNSGGPSVTVRQYR